MSISSKEPSNKEIEPIVLLKQLLKATAVSLGLSTILFVARGRFTQIDLIIFLIVLSLLLLSAWLLRANKILWVAHGFTAVLWLSLTLFMVVYGSFHVPNPGAYILVIFLATLLVRGQAPFIYVGLSILGGIFLTFAHNKAFIPLYQPTPTWIATFGNSYPKAILLLLLIAAAFFTLRFLLITLRFNEESIEQIRQTLGKRTADLSVMNDKLRHEIAERQQTESALGQERIFLRQIIDTTPHFVFVKDKDGRFVIINKALAAAYNSTPQKLEGKSAREVNPHAQEIDKFEQGDQVVLTTQEEVFWPEILFTDLNNKKHWLQVVKRPIVDKLNNTTLVLGIATDITLYKAATESLRETEERIRALVEASFDGIIVCVDHIIQEANINFASMFGFPSIEAAIGKNATTLLTTNSHEQLRKVMQGEHKMTLEIIGIRQDNKLTFPLEVVSQPIIYKGKRAQISGFRDISSRKQAEEAEIQAQRLESPTIMAGGLAHDFNNLLVAMMGQISIAKAKISEEHPSLENLDKAMQVTETAALLTRQLLAYTGQGHFQVEAINLNTLIQQNLQLFQDTLPANILFKTNLDAHLPHIQADGVQIQQIIMNLLLNAAQAIGTKAGTITITTTPYHLNQDAVEQWQHYNHSVAAGDYILLEVADTGQGMDEATQNRIFDPFFSTKGTGRGLGLAAVLGIVRGHKGGIRTKSQTDVGTTFQLLFPLNETISLEKETAVSQTQPQQKSVLVIDDERQVREAVSDILELEEINLLTAANGQDGVAIFSNHQDHIGLVILDLSMPGMSGIETFAALREIEPAAKIILSSGYTETEILQNMAGARPTGFLQKPYQLEAMINIVKKHLS